MAGYPKKPPGGGIYLQRVGGLSPTKQAKGSAPEKYGLWAFIWPHYEGFLTACTNASGRVPYEKSRAYQVQKNIEKLRKFAYKGPLYTHFSVPGGKEIDGWCLTDADSLYEYLGNIHAGDVASMRKQGYGLSATAPKAVYDDDDYEVFVPDRRASNKKQMKELREYIRCVLLENPMGAGLVDPTNLTNAPYAYDYDALGMNAPNAPGKPYDYNSIRPEDPFEYLGFHVSSKEDDENETSAAPPSAAGDEDVDARGDEQPESADEIE